MTQNPARISEGGLVLLLGALVAFGPLAIDLYLPALPAIAAGLAATPEAVQLSVTVFLAGFSFGMLFYGPISDRYGRRRVMLGGIGLFVVASIACMLAGAVEQLIVARLFQAIGGGSASVLARAVARDVYSPTEAIRKLSLMAMVTSVAPLLAPLIGSGVLALWGWRAAFGVLLAWGVASLVVVWRKLPETLPANKRGQLPVGRAFAAYGTMLASPAAIGLVLAGGMSFAAMFAYITGGPHFFIDMNGFSPTGFSLVFAANAVGIFAANYANSRLVRRVGPPTMLGGGSLAGLAGALGLMAAMASGSVPGAIVGLFVVVSVTGLLGANCVGLLMSHFPQNAGAAAALFGAGQFGFGMLASFGVSHFHDGTGQPMAWVVLIACALSTVGFGLYRVAARPQD